MEKEFETPSTAVVATSLTRESAAPFIEAKRFSKWEKLKQTAYKVLKFLSILKKANVSMREIIIQAETALFRQAQLEISKEDIKKFDLKPDESGVYRVYGRLGKLDENKEKLIFLPRHDRITELLILKAHEESGHFGTAQTLCKLRDKFWISKGKRTVRKILQNECFHCKRWKAQPFKLPRMGELAPERLFRSRPFQNTAIDYAGPVQTKQINGEIAKRWICLFTCLTTRAIHLEGVCSLSTADFLNAFKRFLARRGTPEKLLSDNGTQFVAAAEHVNAEWKFITAYSPWKGGVYERLIGLTKQAFRKAIGRRLLTEGEFDSLLVQVEGILNKRPLTPIDDDTSDVIRPIDFINPRIKMSNPIDIPAQDEYLGQNGNRTVEKIRKYFQKTEECLNEFWEYSHESYLQYLRERAELEHRQSKYRIKRTPIDGEVVLLGEENIPRGEWKLARVTEIVKSNDKAVRTVKLRLGGGRECNRPLSHVYPLEIRQEAKTVKEATERELGDSNIERESDSFFSACTQKVPKLKVKSLFYLLTITCFIAIANAETFKLCMPENKGSLLSVPEPQSCQVDLERAAIGITEIFARTYKRTPAILCVNVTLTVCTKAFLRISLKVIKDKTERQPISAENCQKLYDNKYHEVTLLHRTSPNRWESNQQTQYSFGWFGTRCSVTKNYVVEVGAIASLDGNHLLTDLSSTEGCSASEGSCKSAMGTVLWNPEDLKHECGFRSRGMYRAFVKPDRVYVDELQSTFLLSNKTLPLESCDIAHPLQAEGDIVLSFPGIPKEASVFLWLKRHGPNKEKLIHEFKTRAQEIWKTRKQIYLVEPDPGLGKSDTNNQKLQYLFDKVSESVDKKLAAAFQQRCEINNSLLRHLKHISEKDPTLAAQLLLRREDIVAVNVGEAILVNPCKYIEPEQVFYSHQVKGVCFEDLPLRIGRRLVFASPRTKIIKGSSSRVDCGKQYPPVYKKEGIWRTDTDPVQVENPLHKLISGVGKSQVKFSSGILADIEKERVALELNMLGTRNESEATLLKLPDQDVESRDESFLQQFEDNTEELFDDMSESLVQAGKSLHKEIEAISNSWKWQLITATIVICLIILALLFLRSTWRRMILSLLCVKKHNKPKPEDENEAVPLSDMPNRMALEAKGLGSYPKLSTPTQSLTSIESGIRLVNRSLAGNVPAQLKQFEALSEYQGEPKMATARLAVVKQYATQQEDIIHIGNTTEQKDNIDEATGKFDETTGIERIGKLDVIGKIGKNGKVGKDASDPMVNNTREEGTPLIRDRGDSKKEKSLVGAAINSSNRRQQTPVWALSSPHLTPSHTSAFTLHSTHPTHVRSHRHQ